VSEAAPPARSSWRVVNLVLITLALVLVVALAVFVVQAVRTDPAQTRIEKSAREFSAVRKSAKDEVLAFLTVDYTNMDPLIAKVLAGATGSFKQQYSGARANLTESATNALAVSTGKVRSVGVGELTGSAATVFVAADSSVKNKSTGQKAQPRYYRLQLSMQKVGSQWRTANLQFVG
jgi:Mce-associated membrane protein